MIQKKCKTKTKKENKQTKQFLSGKKPEGIRLNRQMLTASYIFAGLFVLLCGYFAYVAGISAPKDSNNSYNKLQNLLSNSVVRGNIYSSDGKLLAETTWNEKGEEERSYPYGREYCHVVGSVGQGRYGLEAAYNFELLTSTTSMVSKFLNDFQDEKDIGDNLVTTLNSEIQHAAYEALSGYKGAVVVMDSKTGAVLAMVSAPAYNPNTIAEDWESVNEDKDGILLNRATQGLYTPGSIFKLFTLSEYLRQGGGLDYSYTCTGSITVEGTEIHCNNHQAHGQVNLEESVAYSCNTSFINLGMQLNTKEFQTSMQKLLFQRSLPLKLGYKQSVFPLSETDSDFVKAQTYFGQGDTLISPIHAAMVMSAVANDGVLMQPYFIEQIQNKNQKVIKTTEPKKEQVLFDAEINETLKTYLRAVVEYGTAKKLNAFEHLKVYGKTGTAEIDSDGRFHSWFIGFAEQEETQKSYTIAVVAENLSSGSGAAVNIANKILKVLD